MKIACLPVAGKQNPYQYLMIDGLNKSNGIKAFNGHGNRFFGIIITALKYKPTYLHFDWIQSYYIRKNFLLTILLLPNFMWQVFFIKYLTKTRVVWTLHNIMPHNVKNVWFHKWVRKWFANQCAWIRVFAESSVLKAVQEIGVPQHKIKVVPEGDYTQVYPNKISLDEARQILNLDNNDTVLLYLGYIKPYKGIKHLIEAFDLLKAPHIKLLIAGEGINKKYVLEIKELLNKLSTPNIILKDTFIREEDLQVYYNAANIVVLPFEKVENSGSAIMAMGFKKAILAPRAGVLKKRLSQQDELLYNDLTEGLQSIINLDKSQLNTIGNNNLKALTAFKWKDFSICFNKK